MPLLSIAGDLLDRIPQLCEPSPSDKGTERISYSSPVKSQEQALSYPKNISENEDNANQNSVTTGKKQTNLFFCIKCLILISFLSVLIVLAARSYIDYKQKSLEMRARLEQEKNNSQIVMGKLEEKADDLLHYLDKLTSLPKMQAAFPSINSMYSIAKFKRGPALSDKAKAAIEFMTEVKTNFETWRQRPQDFQPEYRPNPKEISYFLSAWEEAENLLKTLPDK